VKKRSPWEIQKAVVFALIMREIKTRLGGNWMGVLWLIGIPLAQMLMLVWINTVLRGRLSRAGYEFMIYLVVALIPYDIFRSLWGQLSKAVKANRGLFGYRQVKPMDTFVARTLLELTLQLLILVAVLILFGRLGYGPVIPVDPLAYLAATGMFALLGAGLGLLTAVISQAVPRFEVFVSLVAMPLYLLSGIIFQFWNLPPEMLGWVLYNPLFHLVDIVRSEFLPAYVLHPGISWLYPLKFIAVVWAFALPLYRLRKQQLISS